MNIILGILIMCIVTPNPEKAHMQAKDEAAIKTIIESVGTLADTHNFEALEALYAPEVEVDYTSLAGGERELKSAKTLMTEWASVLPGFDRTRHAIGNIQVSTNGQTATATADVVADHYVDDLFWQVKGGYLYRLEKKENMWQITSHTFNLKEESGTRDVFGPAMANAEANPVSYLIRQQTRQAVIDMLTALETKDMEAFGATWAEDAVHDMPYSPGDFPKRVSGKSNIEAHFAGWPENSGQADFTSEMIFYPMQDPEIVFVEFKGDAEILSTGRNYKQQYGGLFHVEKGKIKLFREYYDPAPFKYAFGL